jgi:peroxiredoxin
MIRNKIASASWPAVVAIFICIGMSIMTATPPVQAADEAPGPVQSELNALKAKGETQVPAELLEAGRQGTEELRNSGILKSALAVGAPMPPFALEDAHGKSVSSKELLSQGPLVVIFYRGAWCPFCNLYLSSVQKYLPQIEAQGATLVAISGEKPDRSLNVEQTNALSFPILSDPELTAARDFGIAYVLPKVVDDAIKGVGFDMAAYYGTEKPELPLSATYVIDRDGTVAYAFVTVDYKLRAEPEEFLAVLSAMNQEKAP